MIYKSPAVSVIIPTYNRACSIRRSVQSVLNQTFNDFEVIIIDDGSTDDTKKVLKNFYDKRIRYFGFKYNRGAAIARNIGIKFANGYFISFQDSDDEWLPRKLEKQINIFKEVPPNVGVVYSGFWKVKGGKKIYIPRSSVVEREGDIHNELLKENFITLQAVVIRKECFCRAGLFDESLKRFSDWELLIRISKYYKFKYIKEPLVKVFYTPSSISSDIEAYIKANEIIINRYYPEMKSYKKALAKRYYMMGHYLYKKGKVKKGRKYFLVSIKTYPLHVKSYILFFITICGVSFYKKLSRIKKYFDSLSIKISLNHKCLRRKGGLNKEDWS